MRHTTTAAATLSALAALATAATALAARNPTPDPDSLDMPSYERPAAKWRDIEDPIERARCKEQISRARADAGQPEIESEPADPEDPLLIAAVDQKIAGCSVLVMKHDTSDIRPIPEPAKGPVSIEPAN